MPIVTIRGQLGSGAPEIGKAIAGFLHADYIDREIIAGVAARLQRQEHDVLAKEMPPSTLVGRIAEALDRGYPSAWALRVLISPPGKSPWTTSAIFRPLSR